jgi:hypothetical protein
MSWEGRARVWLIHRALERGFIHIRLDVRRRWLVSLAHLGPAQQEALSRWALEARKERWAGEPTPVLIDCKADGTVHQTTIREWLDWPAQSGSPMLLDGKLEEQSC